MRGEFRKVEGHVVIDEVDVTRSSVDVTIDASSIDTHDEKRDQHLRSADFFDVEAHPTLTFKSKRVQAGKGGGLFVTGDLTLRSEVDADGNALVRVQYKDAEEWYVVTGTRTHLSDPADIAALHAVAVGILNRPEG